MESENFKIISSGLTDRGNVRPSNQDAYICDDDLRLYVVCDGMGGHAGGEIASSLCCEYVFNYLKTHLETLGTSIDFGDDGQRHPDLSVYRLMQKGLCHASRLIFEKSLEEPHLKGMGTTASLVLIFENHAYWAQVGDSRVFLMRSGMLYQITEDHSLISEQVRAGILKESEAKNHQLSNVITRSIGFQEEEDVDVGCFRLAKDDQILICSDGFHGKLNPQLWTKDLLKKNEALAKTTSNLMARALREAGDDNVTIIVLKVV